VKLDPNDGRSLNNLAWLLLEQNKPMEALPYALRAVKRSNR
jgi:Tfp pilus assembly protein PilF